MEEEEGQNTVRVRALTLEEMKESLPLKMILPPLDTLDVLKAKYVVQEEKINSEEEEDIPMEELSRIEQKRRLIKIDMLNKQKLEDVKEEIDKNKVEEKVPAKKRNIKEIIEETKKKFEARERELAEAGDGMGSAGQNQAYNKAFPSNARFINAEI